MRLLDPDLTLPVGVVEGVVRDRIRPRMQKKMGKERLVQFNGTARGT